MAKNFKRAIAVLLSALMIATSLPFTAITASAYTALNSKKPVYTDDMGASFAKNGFTGAYRYEGYQSDAYTIEYLYNPGDKVGSDTCAINIGDINTAQGKRNYLEIKENGKFHFVYSDGANDISVKDMWGDGDFFGGTKLESNKWYIIDAVITNDNGKDIIKTYLNGVYKTTIEMEFANKDYTLCKYLANAHPVQFGLDCGWWDNDTDGYVDNFYVYDYAKSEDEIGKMYSSAGKFRGIVTAGYYNNLLYCSNDTTWAGTGSADTQKNQDNLSLKVAIPGKVVMLYDGKNEASFPVKFESWASKGDAKNYQYITSGANGIKFVQNWTRNSKAWDTWIPTVNENQTGFASDHENNTGTNEGDNTNTHRFWYNKAVYDATTLAPTNDNGDYYNAFTKIQCNLKHTDSANEVWVENSASKFYVVNYKPIADIYDSVPARVAELKAEVAIKPAGYYTNANEIDTVANAVLTLDPNAYDYAGNTESAVQACAADIKSVVNAYNSFELVKHECVEGEAKDENVVLPTASKAGSHNVVVRCTICNEILSTTPVEDPATGKYEAYNGFVTLAESKVENEYTAESWDNLQKKLAEAKEMADNAETQDDIDAAAAMIQTAINDLELKGFTVTVNVQKNGESVGTITETVNSGDVYTYSAQDGDVIYKATVNDDKRIVNNVDSFEVVVTKDITIDVYLANYVAEDTKVKAVFKNISGAIVSIQYYDKAEDITEANMPNGPVVPFYAFAGWHLASSTDNVREYIPVYDAGKLDMCKVIAASNEITVKGMPEYSAAYDEIIGVSTPANTVAIGMYADEECTDLLAVVDSTTYIHAPHRDYVYVKPLDWAGPSIGITGKYSYIDNAGMQTVVFNGNKYGDATEVGVIATVNPVLAGEYADFFVVGQKGVVKAESTKQTKIGEFTVAIHSDFGDYEKVYARPYMVVDGQTIYGNIVELGIAQKS